jgi:hypothetical protein
MSSNLTSALEISSRVTGQGLAGRNLGLLSIPSNSTIFGFFSQRHRSGGGRPEV